MAALTFLGVVLLAPRPVRSQTPFEFQAVRRAGRASLLAAPAWLRLLPALAAPSIETAGSSSSSTDPTYRPAVAWMLAPTKVADAKAATEGEMKRYTEKISGTDVTFDMVLIPGGTFLMGSPAAEEDRSEDEGPQFEAAVDPFWMGKCEVTWDQYELWAMGLDQQIRRLTHVQSTDHDRLADAVSMPTKPYADMSFGMGKNGFPAICMTQLAAKVYCKWLSAKTGRYYRLPTEAEWEYACRAGTTTAYSFGDDPEQLPDYAWYFDTSDDKYQKVGQKKPNAWGLYDMYGNVAEWVLDQYTPDGYGRHADKPAKNPLVATVALYPRVVRGGSWLDDPDRLRSAARQGSGPAWKAQDPQLPRSIWYHTDANFVGFRVVRPLRKPSVTEARRYELDETQRTTMAEYAEIKGAAP